MGNRIAVDIGGTFTDLVVWDPSGARTTKVLSTPPDLVRGVLEALDLAGCPLEEVDLFVHGTTAGLNAVLERRGARVALATTRGFRDVYLIGRGHRPEMYNLRYRKPMPLLERDAIFEINERVGADGGVLEPLDETSVHALADAVEENGFDAIAVCLLHSYLNPVHELRVRDLLARRLPKVAVVTSHEVAPEWREYERTSTTVMSAYITPIMRDYLGELAGSLRLKGMQVPPYITQSSGGVMTAAAALDRAVLTLFSGPVGGAVGGRALGEELGEVNLICVDVGGTSFDVSLVRGGEASVQSEFDLQGLPVLAPAVEVHTIGAGGGSLIMAPSGRLQVGPQSAGANPGPACYGHGGEQPTVTDANLVLGRLPVEQRLAGRMPLDAEAAHRALGSVGAQLGLDAVDLAEQALEVVHFRMAEAIRELTVERGLDPRDFTLCAFGGAGGLHATALAEELEIGRVLVPALPGAFSAWGMLQGSIRYDAVRAFYRPLDEAGAELPGVLDDLTARVRRLLEAEGLATPDIRCEPAADLRYVGQEYSLTLPLGVPIAIDRLAEQFHDAYQARYGHASPGEQVEFVAVRMAGFCDFDRPRATRRPSRPDTQANAAIGETLVRYGGGEVRTPLYDRRHLASTIEGPAIVLEETATTLVPPGWSGRGIGAGHLVLERNGRRP